MNWTDWGQSVWLAGVLTGTVPAPSSSSWPTEAAV